VLLELAALAQQFPDSLCASPGRLYFLKRHTGRQLAAVNALEQPALKQPAPFRPLRVEFAKLAIETRARLRERQLGFRLLPHGQPEFRQPLGIITRAQFHIRE